MKKFIKRLAITYCLVILALNSFALKSEAKYSNEYTFGVSSNVSSNSQVDYEIKDTEIAITYDNSTGETTVTALNQIIGINKIELYKDDELIAIFEYNENKESVTFNYDVGTDFMFYENLYVIVIDAEGNTKQSNVIIPNPDKIYDLNDLIRFRNVVNNEITDFSDCTVYLMESIDMSTCENWIPIGANGTYFAGTFEGGLYTIFNLTIETSDDYCGLFSILKGKVNELNISGSIISTGNYVGSIAGSLEGGSVSYVKNSVTISTTGSSYIGGIAGYNNHGYIEYCGNSASITTDGTYVGGVVGFTTANPNVENVIYVSYNTGNITANDCIGGIIGAGYDIDCENYQVVIRDVYNQGSITILTDSSNNGGILGGTLYSCTGTTATGSNIMRYGYNTGTITSNGDGKIYQIAPDVVDTCTKMYYLSGETNDNSLGTSKTKSLFITSDYVAVYTLLNEYETNIWYHNGIKYPIFIWQR